VGKKTNVLFILVYSTHKKTAQRVCFITECLQYASTTCFIIIVWVSSFSPLLGHTRYQGSQSVVSSSRTARPSNTWGGRWIGHWKTTWSSVRSSVPHPQAAEAAIPRAGLKAREVQGNFHWRAPIAYFMTSSFVNLCFRRFATFSFAFSCSRLCACRINSIVSRIWLYAARNGV